MEAVLYIEPFMPHCSLADIFFKCEGPGEQFYVSAPCFILADYVPGWLYSQLHYAIA